MVDIKKIISYLIPLIFMVILASWLFAGSFPGLKEKVYSIKTYVDFGVEKEIGATPTIPPTHADAIDRLMKTIKEMHESAVPNCFANYGDLPDLGEKGTSINFQYDALNDKTLVTIKGGREGEQIISLHEGKGTIELPGVRPCVIAGKYSSTDIVPANFFNKILDHKGVDANSHYFTFVNSLAIKSDTYGVNGNAIRSPEIGLTSISKNFFDGGYLFTPDGNNICFFPTSPGISCNEGEWFGLSNNCLGDESLSDRKSVAYGLSIGSLNSCVKKNILGEKRLGSDKRYSWIELAGQGENNPPSDPILISSKCISGINCHTLQSQCDIYANILASDGCSVIASDKDQYWFDNNDCASGVAKVGSTIYSDDPTLLLMSDKNIIQSSIKGDADAQNLLSKEFKWQSTESLFCGNDHFWYPCDLNFMGNVIESRPPSLDGSPNYVQCVKEQGKGYIWVEFSDDDQDLVEDDYDPLRSYGGVCHGGEYLSCFDNCPYDANPKQEDEDGDGVGDVCDRCPDLVAGSVEITDVFGNPSTKYFGTKGCPDGDADGHADKVFLKGGTIGISEDNCRADACEGKVVEINGEQKTLTALSCANPDQKDSDTDGIGDVCDTEYLLVKS